MEYTLNTPVKAKLVCDKKDWKGNFDFERD